MNQTEATRTLTMADHLRDPVAADHFALYCYLSQDEDDLEPRSLAEVLDSGSTGCGTTACVAGHAVYLWPKTFEFFKKKGGFDYVRRIGTYPVIAREEIAGAMCRWFGLEEHSEDWDTVSAWCSRGGVKTAGQVSIELEAMLDRAGWQAVPA